MGLQTAFDSLSDIVEQLERRGRSIRNIEARTDPDSAGSIAVTMTVPVSLCGASGESRGPSLTPERASLSQSEGLTVTVSVSDTFPTLTEAETVADLEEQTAHVDDGELLLTVGFRVGPTDPAVPSPTSVAEPTASEEQPNETPDEGATEDANGNDDTLAARLLAAKPDDVPPGDSTDSTPPQEADDSDADTLTARLATARTDSVPAYEDTEYLRLLYESCETFTEMSDHIEMDVAAETVRRYMIAADIHDPTSYDTETQTSTGDDTTGASTDGQPAVAGDHDAAVESTGPGLSQSVTEEMSDEQFVTDGIGLPDGVTVDDIVTTVVDSTAVYEVQRSLDLGHSQTRSLLRQLNLLDLVLGRINDTRRELSEADVLQRIRQCDAGAA